VAVKKLSISVEVGLGDEIAREARVAGVSLSAWLADAAAAKIRRNAWRDYFAEIEREHGPFTVEERAQARRDLGIDPPPEGAP
jgi:hypothetical protein